MEIGLAKTLDELKSREALIDELQFMRLSAARLAEEVVRLQGIIDQDKMSN